MAYRLFFVCIIHFLGESEQNMHDNYSRWRPKSKMASGGHLGFRTPFWRIYIHTSIWHTQEINSTYKKDPIYKKKTLLSSKLLPPFYIHLFENNSLSSKWYKQSTAHFQEGIIFCISGLLRMPTTKDNRKTHWRMIHPIFYPFSIIIYPF